MISPYAVGMTKANPMRVKKLIVDMMIAMSITGFIMLISMLLAVAIFQLVAIRGAHPFL